MLCMHLSWKTRKIDVSKSKGRILAARACLSKGRWKGTARALAHQLYLLHGMSGLLALLVHWDHWPQFLSDLAINVDAVDCVETHFSSITLSREAGVALVAVKHPTNHIFS